MSRMTLYLLLVGGIPMLVRALYLTRATWREDIAPFSRSHRMFQIALHPENYARADRLGQIRMLNRVGGLLLCAALLVVLYDIYESTLGRRL